MAHGSNYFAKGSLKRKETKGTNNSSYSILGQTCIISFILPNNLIVYSLNACVLFDCLFVLSSQSERLYKELTVTQNCPPVYTMRPDLRYVNRLSPFFPSWRASTCSCLSYMALWLYSLDHIFSGNFCPGWTILWSCWCFSTWPIYPEALPGE